MLKNITIKRMIIIVGTVIVFSNLVNIIIGYTSLNNMVSQLKEKEKEILPHAFSFLNLKIDVIQVQQWLTDISATRAAKGFDDGFSEAEKYYDDGNKILEHLIKEHRKYNEPEMVNDLIEFKSNFQSF